MPGRRTKKDAPQTGRFTKRQTIWAERRDAPRTDPEQLTVEARMVVAAIHSLGVLDEEIAATLRMEPKRVSLILSRLRSSRQPAARRVMELGLPMHASVRVPLEWGLRCRRCQSRISSLPCVKCWVEAGKGDDWPVVEEDMGERPQCTVPTLSGPGTWAKVEIMKARYEAGLALFSDRDAKWGSEFVYGTPPCSEDDEGMLLWPQK